MKKSIDIEVVIEERLQAYKQKQMKIAGIALCVLTFFSSSFGLGYYVGTPAKPVAQVSPAAIKPAPAAIKPKAVSSPGIIKEAKAAPVETNQAVKPRSP